MNPRTPPNVAQPCGISEPKERERNRTTTFQPPQHPREAPNSSGSGEAVFSKNHNTVDDLHPAAQAALADLTHRGNPEATARTISTKFLYPADDEGYFADPSVKGLDYPTRLRVVADAVLEMADQGGAWSARRLAGFIRNPARPTNTTDHAAGFIATDADYEVGGIYHVPGGSNG